MNQKNIQLVQQKQNINRYNSIVSQWKEAAKSIFLVTFPRPPLTLT